MFLVIGIIVYWAFGFAFAYGKVVEWDNDVAKYSAANTFIGNLECFFKLDFEID